MARLADEIEHAEVEQGAEPRLITGENILCISSIDWDFIWQGHQEIMAALARHGNRVLFIENTGVRSPRLRDLPRLKHRLLNWRNSTKGFRQERENLFVYSPLILPFPYSALARWINRTLLLRALQRWMWATRFHRPIVWTFLPTPLILDIVHALDPEITVYYCIDDLASSSPEARRITRSETALFRQADLVFVTSEKLRERAARHNDRVHVFPFGVEFEWFEQVRKSADPMPADLQRLPRPIVGYVGGIHQWVDQALFAQAARALPQASFVLIGPAQIDIAQLSRLPNVHCLGPRSHEDVPRYIKGFDVGLIPYTLSEYTAHVYPTKLNEYLAMGIPVVSTELPELRRFSARHANVVTVARDAETFIQAVKASLAPSSVEDIRRRLEASKSNSWQARIGEMSSLMEARLAARRSAGVRWQESLRRMYRAARRRVAVMALVAVCAYLILFKSPVLWIVAEPLRMSSPARPAEAIVVFAGGMGESGNAGEGYQERVKHAVDLYRSGAATRLLLVSGYTFVFPEAEVMQDLAVAQGIPASAILTEKGGTNTFEHVQYVRGILEAHGLKRILLVSSPYHMRRAIWTFRKVAPEIDVIPSPVPNSRFYGHRWEANPAQLKAIVHEYLGIAYYRLRGWL